MYNVSTKILELLSATDGLEKLRNQFKDGKFNKLDYCYFSPQKSKKDKVKYPLIVYIHGLAHGWRKRSQVNDSYFPYMISKEMQSKFFEGGAHILLPRLPEYMFDIFYTSKLQKLINNYVKKHFDNIDINQIIIMGSSAGGGMAWRLLIRHPKFYSKALITCANKVPSKQELKVVADKTIWLVAAKKDPIIPFFSQKFTWNRLKKITKIPNLCRFTVFNKDIYCPDGKKAKLAHMLAKVISYNFEMIEGVDIPYDGENYPFTQTKLATNEIVPTYGIIEWLQNDY